MSFRKTSSILTFCIGCAILSFLIADITVSQNEHSKSSILGISDEIISREFFGPSDPKTVTAPQDVQIDANGDYYISTSDTVGPAIRKYDATKTLLTEWGANGAATTNTIPGNFTSIGGMTKDSAGNLYVLDVGGSIAKYDANDNFLIEWGTTGTGNGQFNVPQDITTDTLNNIYVVDTGNSRIQKFDSSGTYITQWVPGINWPLGGIATDSANNVYICETGDSQLGVYTDSGVLVTHYAITCNDVAIASTGNIYTIVYNGTGVQEFASNGTLLTQWPLSGYLPAEVQNSFEIRIDSNDFIYVSGQISSGAWQDPGIVTKYDTSGTLVDTLTVDLRAVDAFHDINAMAVAPSGNVYVTDETKQQVFKLDSNGNILLTWGTPGTGNGQFTQPMGISVDDQENVYVVDALQDRVQKFDSAGNYLMQFGSSGSGNGQLSYPESSPLIDSTGNIYIVDEGNNRIQKFDSAGTYLLQWGTFGAGNGQFSYPTAIDQDSSGNIFVSDWGNNRVQIFDSNGVYISQWQVPGPNVGELATPYGLAIDDFDHVYVTDFEFAQILLFQTDGTLVNSWNGGMAGTVNGILDPWFAATDSSGYLYFSTELPYIQRFLFDRLAPTNNLTPLVNNETSDTTPTFSATSTDSLGTITLVEFSLNDGAFAACTADDGTFDEASETYTCSIATDLALGTYTFKLRSTDNLGNISPALSIPSYSFSIVVPVTPTPTPTATTTPTATPTGTVTATPLTTTVIATPTVTPTTTLPTTISTITPTVSTQIPPANNTTPQCPIFEELTVSSAIIESTETINFSWKTTNATYVSTKLTPEKLPASGELNKITLSNSQTIEFIAHTQYCIAKKSVSIDVVANYPWKNTAALSAGILTVEAAIALAQPTMFGNIWLALAATIDRKKKQKWGVVYDAKTKKPLARAVIRLARKADKTIIDTVVTDVNGTFRLHSRIGTYELSVQLHGYTFPSKVITSDVDFGYSNVYHGNDIEVKDATKGILISIPLDPTVLSSTEAAQLKTRQLVRTLISITANILVIVGFGYSSFVAIRYPHTLNYLILTVYSVFALIKLALHFPRKTEGRLTFTDGTQAKGIEIGLFDPEFNTLLYRTFSNDTGEFSFVVPNRMYKLQIVDNRYRIIKHGEKVASLQIQSLANGENILIVTRNLTIG